MSPNGEQPHRATYRFVHASDLQLEVPVRGVAAPPASVRGAFRDAALRAWQSLIELAIEREAAFVVLAGGLFGDATPAVRSCVALHDGVERLRAHGIEIFFALDRDDAAAAMQLPWLARSGTIFTALEVGTARVIRDGRWLATVHGSSGDARAVTRLTRQARRIGGGLEIGVLALQAEPAAGTPPAVVEQLSGSDLDYWALGGSSASGVLHENPWVVCAGTPQGRSLEPAHLGPKGCMLVEVDDGRVGTVTPVPLDHVRFLHLELDVGGCSDAAAIRRLLVRALERGTAAAGDRLVAVDACLRGRLPAHASRDRLSFEVELVGQLRRESAARDARVWWIGVRDLTTREDHRPTAWPWELRRILTEQSEALSAPLPGSTFLAQTFAPLLRQWGAETDLPAQRELIRDAATLALDALGPDEPV